MFPLDLVWQGLKYDFLNVMSPKEDLNMFNRRIHILKINCTVFFVLEQYLFYCLKLVFMLLGVLYMVLKHLVDRYNIYFAYGPSKISSRIHASAINIVIISIILQQLSFTSLSLLRRGFNDISIYSLVGFCIALLFLSAQIFLNWCKGFSPVLYKVWPVLQWLWEFQVFETWVFTSGWLHCVLLNKFSQQCGIYLTFRSYMILILGGDQLS